jgi:hypothetical protein
LHPPHKLHERKKDACEVASIFFSQKKARKKNVCLRMMKNCQHQNKGKPHTQENFQDAAISVEDAIIIFRGLNLCSEHFRVKHIHRHESNFFATLEAFQGLWCCCHTELSNLLGSPIGLQGTEPAV